MNYKRIIRNIFRIVLFGFALVGLVFSFVYVGMKFGWFNVRGSISERNSYFYLNNKINKVKNNQDTSTLMPTLDWAKTDQWLLMKEVFTRDEVIIKKAASDAQVSPRIILSCVMGEQFRFFSSRRESFKSYFEPLKILASLSNTSFGIAGLKPKTIGQIEDNMKNKNSVYYLGPEMEHIVDYPDGTDIASEQMNRITDSKNPYYSYLYVGLYIKEVMTQWQKSGYDISHNAGVLATLYNLGFFYSIPKPNPEFGGSVISINNIDYTFGDIAYEFYYSNELSDIYPIDVQ